MQLVHDSTETSWEDHGFVRIKNADGELLAECVDFQHNRQCGTLSSRTVALVAEVMAAMASRPRSGKELVDLTAQAGLGNSSVLVRRASKESLSLFRKGSVEIVAKGKDMRAAMDLMAPVGRPSPLRRASSRSGSQPHSRNQHAPRSPFAHHGQQVMRSKVRSNSTSRVG